MAHPAQDAIRAVWELRTYRSDVSSPATFGNQYRIVQQLISEKLVAAGIESSTLKVNQSLSLPGSYGLDRPWDLVVAIDNIPVAAIEMVIQTGPSFTNNFSNRISEFLGMAADVDRHYEADELRPHKPCLGIVFILEQTERSTTPLRRRQGLMVAAAESSAEISVQERYAKFFEKLLDDHKYDVICYLAATPLPNVKVSEPRENMSFERFVETVAQRARAVKKGPVFAPTVLYRLDRATLAGHVFISYVREDSHQVDRLQWVLETAGVRVWRDTADLWPGEDWRAKIRHAITDDAFVFLACFSGRSLARRKSYQNEELVLAIEQMRLRPPGEPWLIPVRFDQCEIPDWDIGGGRRLMSIQRADLFGDRFDDGAVRLIEAVKRILRHQSGLS